MTKGKLKTTREKPKWLKTSDKEIEGLVVDLAKQGLTSEKIGLELRDKHGIPKAKLTGKKITQILKENDLYQDATSVNLEKKKQLIIKHLEKNKQDEKSKRALIIIKARTTKHNKYKKRKNAEPSEKDSKKLSKRKRK
jgi:ribosomal protein S15P/S13E